MPTPFAPSGGAVHVDAADPRSRSYLVGPDRDFVGSARAGVPFRVSTPDASGDQIRPGVPWEKVDTAAMFPVAGPIAIEGVKTGDAVGVEVLGLRLAATAHCWTRPGIGLIRGADYIVKAVSTGDLTWRADEMPGGGVAITPAPHVGTVGLTPRETRAARDLGDHGGNLDVSILGNGATLWLPAQVDGGGLFLGDVHAGIGDGEVCGTGLEAAADITVTVHHRQDWTPGRPTVCLGTRVWVVGIADTLEAAIAQVVTEMSGLLTARTGLSTGEARLLVSQLLVLRVCQVVNPRPSIIASLSGGLDRLLGPPPIGSVATAGTRARTAGDVA